MTFGFSRDDAGKFLESYYENKIYESDPFAKLDQKGVGQLIEMAAKKGKSNSSRYPLRNLWRTWWRSIICRILLQSRIRLCILLTIPCTNCKISSSSGSIERQIIRFFIHTIYNNSFYKRRFIIMVDLFLVHKQEIFYD